MDFDSFEFICITIVLRVEINVLYLIRRIFGIWDGVFGIWDGLFGTCDSVLTIFNGVFDILELVCKHCLAFSVVSNKTKVNVLYGVLSIWDSDFGIWEGVFSIWDWGIWYFGVSMPWLSCNVRCA